MKSPIRVFCDERGIRDGIRNAFMSYCRTVYAAQYDMMSPDGDTIHAILMGMTESQVKQAWLEFIKDMSSYLPKENVS